MKYLLIPITFALPMNGVEVNLIRTGEGIQRFSYRQDTFGRYVTDMNTLRFFKYNVDTASDNGEKFDSVTLEKEQLR